MYANVTWKVATGRIERYKVMASVNCKPLTFESTFWAAVKRAVTSWVEADPGSAWCAHAPAEHGGRGPFSLTDMYHVLLGTSARRASLLRSLSHVGVFQLKLVPDSDGRMDARQVDNLVVSNERG